MSPADVPDSFGFDDGPPAAAPEVTSRWREAFDKARQENAERRARVLKHPDLAALLCQPPLPWSRPEHWNGFIPPRFLPPDSKGITHPNYSPERDALVEISAEAMRRESTTERKES